ncbi:MAG TPA: helix-turn-helix domain-containing protein [Solirubrobacterales bacterium]|nr:helix-turn-helix domain-containing protein [Solirubrobacterales bacterium]
MAVRGLDGVHLRRPIVTSDVHIRRRHVGRQSEVTDGIRARLGARQPELEQAILNRVYAVFQPPPTVGPEYRDGLLGAVSAALDYAIAGVQAGDAPSTPIPVALLAQARLAARNGISLDTVIRRYVAGSALFEACLVEEVTSDGHVPGTEVRRLLAIQATLLDHLLGAVSEEYALEQQRLSTTHKQGRASLVEGLLEGKLLDATELAYDFDNYNLGVVAVGPGSEQILRRLFAPVDARVLVISPADATAWAWLGSRRRPDIGELLRIVASGQSAKVCVALGEPAKGLSGWRLTHRQAAAALSVAQLRGDRLVRYADVLLLSAMLQDNLSLTALREIYLAPLESGRAGGEVSRQTLRAYFASGRHVSSAAAVLGVSRQTVNSRLRAIEGRLGHSLDTCAVELEVALRVEGLGRSRD